MDQENDDRNDREYKRREEERCPNRDEKTEKMADRDMDRGNSSPEQCQAEQCQIENASDGLMKI